MYGPKRAEFDRFMVVAYLRSFWIEFIFPCAHNVPLELCGAFYINTKHKYKLNMARVVRKPCYQYVEWIRNVAGSKSFSMRLSQISSHRKFTSFYFNDGVVSSFSLLAVVGASTTSNTRPYITHEQDEVYLMRVYWKRSRWYVQYIDKAVKHIYMEEGAIQAQRI